MARESKEDRAERQARDEWQMIDVLRRAGNEVVPEFEFLNRHTGHYFRLDYLINSNVALEIQGFGFGHVARKGWLRDISKAQQIAENGWLFCPVTRDHVANGEALEALARCGVQVVAPCPHASGATEAGNCAKCGAKQ